MNKNELELLIEQNYSINQIAKKYGKATSTIVYWLKKFGLKSKYGKFGDNDKLSGISLGKLVSGRKVILMNDWNWEAINNYHHAGFGYGDIKKKFGISVNQLQRAQKQGLFEYLGNSESCKRINKRRGKTDKEKEAIKKSKGRTGKKHSKETIRKISEKRKEYLAKNPDVCVWKTHEKFKSYPCEKVKEELIKSNILFIPEFQPLIHKKRFFSIDIAFPDLKIGIEINGGQHYKEGKLAPYYQERHDLIEAEGWKLYEIPYYKALNIDYMLKFIKEVIN